MNKIHYVLDRIEEYRKKNDFNQKEYSLHYAILMGKNETPVCPSYVKFNSGKSSEHAEMNSGRTINKINKKHKTRKRKFVYTLYVIRFSKTGKLGYSKPCKHCLQSLVRSNIKINRIIYSNEFGNFSWEYFKNCQTSHISWGNRKLRYKNN